MKPLLAVLLVGLTLASTAAAAPLKVYVFTKDNAGGFVDDELKHRQESVADVKKSISDKKYSGVYELVESREAANVLLEVAWRGRLQTDKRTGTATMLSGTSTVVADSNTVTQDNLKLIITIGEYSKEFWGLEPDKKDWLGNVPQRLWRDLAKLGVENVAKWTEQNTTQIQQALVKAASH